MPQVSLYVDDAMMDELRLQAAQEGVSLSKHVARRLKEGATGYQTRCNTPSGMPPGHFERLYGCIEDETFVRPAQLDYSLDAPRLGFE